MQQVPERGAGTSPCRSERCVRQIRMTPTSLRAGRHVKSDGEIETHFRLVPTLSNPHMKAIEEAVSLSAR
jgi:hypothetical protein